MVRSTAARKTSGWGIDCTFFVRLVAGANCRFEHSWAFTEPKRSSSKVSITSSYNAKKRPRLLVSSPNNPTHYRTGSYIKLARKPNALHALLRRVADIPGWKSCLNKPLRLLILSHCCHNCRNQFYRCTLPSSSGSVWEGDEIPVSVPCRHPSHPSSPPPVAAPPPTPSAPPLLSPP